jgi:hypothetical protein
VERDRGHIEQADESSGEDVLSRMLLHVIASPDNIDLTSDMTSKSQASGRSFKVMDNPAVFAVGDLSDAVFRCTRTDPTGVVDLAAACRIKGSSVESDRRPRGFGDVADLTFKIVEKRIVVVEAFGHVL